MTKIPTLRPPHETPPITDLAGLTDYWRALMGPLGFSRFRLWLLFLDADGWLAPAVTTIDDVPSAAEPVHCRNLVHIAQQVLPDGGSFAVLLSRPGRQAMGERDRSWARGLAGGAAAVDAAMWPMHLATDAELRVFAPDDLIG